MNSVKKLMVVEFLRAVECIIIKTNIMTGISFKHVIWYKQVIQETEISAWFTPTEKCIML